MDDNKIVALIMLIIGAFAFWLHAQGKLIPLSQMLFGAGAGSVPATTTASGSGSASFAPGTTIIGALGQVLTTAQGPGGVAPALPQTPAGTAPIVPIAPTGGASTQDNTPLNDSNIPRLPGWGGT